MPQAFIDIERIIAAGLELRFGLTDRVGSETPVSFVGLEPFIRVLRVSGPRDQLNDYANIEIDVFAPTRAVAFPLARDVVDFLCGPPPGIRQLDRVNCPIGPRELDWGDERIRRWNASLEVVSRRKTVV